MVLLSPLMIPWRKELTELSTGVLVVACDTTKDMKNYAIGLPNENFEIYDGIGDFDIKTNITHVVTRE